MNTTNRDLALSFYRINLHGTGWKIESGDFAAAIEMLGGYVRDLVKAKDFSGAGAMKGLLVKVRAHQKAAAKLAA